jgi:uncharacterized repeat protein (TIGR03803 family)
LQIAVVAGLVCAMLAMPSGSWAASQFKVLYTFTGGTDGGNPYSALIFDGSGNLYSTTYSGGQAGCYGGLGCGTVFQLAPNSGGGWTENVVYAFAGQGDGGNPASRSPLIFDAAGNLYGVTVFYGTGTGCEPYGCGTAFEITSNSGNWTQSVLYNFTYNGGDYPSGGLTFDKHGHLYGMAAGGGQYNTGTVFELIQGMGGTWQEKLLHTFGSQDPNFGEAAGNVIFNAAGDLFATASLGGTHTGGVVFELMRNNRKEKTLYNFKCNFQGKCTKDGFAPEAGLIFDGQGSLYGTTNYGGRHGNGTVFKLTPSSGGTWKESILYSFKGGSDGAQPVSSLVFDPFGNLYGTTDAGGIPATECVLGCGTVFKLTPSGGRWTESIMYAFKGASDGAQPYAPLILDSAGNLYGTAAFGGNAGCLYQYGCGVVFEISAH